MNKRQNDALLTELRERMSDMLAAAHLLTPLIRKSGSPADKEYLAAMNKSLFQLIRLLRHADVCEQEEVYCREEPIDLAGLCRDVGRLCEDMSRLLNVSFDWSLGESSVLSLADNYLLEVALFNVLTNAFEAAGEGGAVRLKGGLVDGFWRVTVEDTGPGLQSWPEPSDPFLKQPGGVGLGLEAARRILSLHGGTLMLDNGKEGGVRAVISLPVKKPSRDQLLQSPVTACGPWGGFPPVMIEFSPLLPPKAFRAEELD